MKITVPIKKKLRILLTQQNVICVKKRVILQTNVLKTRVKYARRRVTKQKYAEKESVGAVDSKIMTKRTVEESTVKSVRYLDIKKVRALNVRNLARNQTPVNIVGRTITLLKSADGKFAQSAKRKDILLRTVPLNTGKWAP